MYVGFKRVTMLADYCLLRGTFKLKNRQDGFLRWIFLLALTTINFVCLWLKEYIWWLLRTTKRCIIFSYYRLSH